MVYSITTKKTTEPRFLVLDFDDTRAENSGRPSRDIPTYETSFYSEQANAASTEWEGDSVAPPSNNGTYIPNLRQWKLTLKTLKALNIAFYEGSQRILMAFAMGGVNFRYNQMLRALGFYFLEYQLKENAERIKQQLEKRPLSGQLKLHFNRVYSWLTEVKNYLSHITADTPDSIQKIKKRLAEEKEKPVQERNLFLISALAEVKNEPTRQSVLGEYWRYLGSSEETFPPTDQIAYLGNVDKGILLAAIYDLEGSAPSDETALAYKKRFTLFDDGEAYEPATEAIGSQFLLAKPPKYNLLVDNENLLRLQLHYATPEELVVQLGQDGETPKEIKRQFLFHPLLLHKLYEETYLKKLYGGTKFDEYIESIKEQSPALAAMLSMMHAFRLAKEDNNEAAEKTLDYFRTWLKEQGILGNKELIHNLQLNFPFDATDRYVGFYNALAEEISTKTPLPTLSDVLKRANEANSETTSRDIDVLVMALENRLIYVLNETATKSTCEKVAKQLQESPENLKQNILSLSAIFTDKDFPTSTAWEYVLNPFAELRQQQQQQLTNSLKNLKDYSLIAGVISLEENSYDEDSISYQLACILESYFEEHPSQTGASQNIVNFLLHSGGNNFSVIAFVALLQDAPETLRNWLVETLITHAQLLSESQREELRVLIAPIRSYQLEIETIFDYDNRLTKDDTLGEDNVEDSDTQHLRVQYDQDGRVIPQLQMDLAFVNPADQENLNQAYRLTNHKTMVDDQRAIVQPTFKRDAKSVPILIRNRDGTSETKNYRKDNNPRTNSGSLSVSQSKQQRNFVEYGGDQEITGFNTLFQKDEPDGFWNQISPSLQEFAEKYLFNQGCDALNYPIHFFDPYYRNAPSPSGDFIPLWSIIKSNLENSKRTTLSPGKNKSSMMVHVKSDRLDYTFEVRDRAPESNANINNVDVIFPGNVSFKVDEKLFSDSAIPSNEEPKAVPSVTPAQRLKAFWEYLNGAINNAVNIDVNYLTALVIGIQEKYKKDHGTDIVPNLASLTNIFCELAYVNQAALKQIVLRFQPLVNGRETVSQATWQEVISQARADAIAALPSNHPIRVAAAAVTKTIQTSSTTRQAILASPVLMAKTAPAASRANMARHVVESAPENTRTSLAREVLQAAVVSNTTWGDVGRAFGKKGFFSVLGNRLKRAFTKVPHYDLSAEDLLNYLEQAPDQLTAVCSVQAHFDSLADALITYCKNWNEWRRNHPKEDSSPIIRQEHMATLLRNLNPDTLVSLANKIEIEIGKTTSNGPTNQLIGQLDALDFILGAQNENEAEIRKILIRHFIELASQGKIQPDNLLSYYHLNVTQGEVALSYLIDFVYSAVDNLGKSRKVKESLENLNTLFSGRDALFVKRAIQTLKNDAADITEQQLGRAIASLKPEDQTPNATEGLKILCQAFNYRVDAVMRNAYLANCGISDYAPVQHETPKAKPVILPSPQKNPTQGAQHDTVAARELGEQRSGATLTKLSGTRGSIFSDAPPVVAKPDQRTGVAPPQKRTGVASSQQ